MAAKRHQKKEVRDAIDAVLADPWWRLERGGHWGFLLCGRRERDGCRIAINATPQSADSHAARIVRESLKCPHRAGSGETT